jgi:hypothetical protein
MARDFGEVHPTVEMDGDKPCMLCKHVRALGFCTVHKTDVSVFDGCKSHEPWDGGLRRVATEVVI